MVELTPNNIKLGIKDNTIKLKTIVTRLEDKKLFSLLMLVQTEIKKRRK